ncbi:MAG: TlpA family protein disulfide reductase [Mycobacterium sp.]
MVIVALIAALIAETGARVDEAASVAEQVSRDRRDADTAESLAGPRGQARLAPCPAAVDGPGPEALRSITLECAGDGRLVDVGRALAGRVVVLNLWAYWCVPCAAELAAMAEYQNRIGTDVTVVTVHQDENETAALLGMAELEVRLPTLQDGRRRIAAALRVPNVMPATVVLRADGTVAAIMPRAFDNADDIAAAVDGVIGVPK